MNFIMVEDHNLVLNGVSKIIDEKSTFKCIGTFSSPTQTKAFLADYCKMDYEPLICIIDINLKDSDEEYTLGEDGLSLIKFIKNTYTNIFCLCYSMYKGAGIVEQAVKARADGYISKKTGLEVILQAMEKVGTGKFYLEESLTSDYVVYTNLFNCLTNREKELVELFFQKKDEEEIAQIMGIKIHAVDNYMTRIISKLGVVSKKELLQKFGDVI